MTAVHGVHLSRIGSIDAVERAKGELVEALPAAADGGVAILNADDPRVRRMDARTRALPMTYGFADDADVRAVDLRSRARDGMAFRLLARGDAIEMTIPTLGRLSVHNALAGAAVGLAAGLDLATIAAALGGGWSAPHRGVLIDAGGVTIVDDSYNASPASVQAALELIGGFPGRHVAVLGEMKELGSGHDEGHRIAGEAAARGAELVVVVDGEPGGPAHGIVEGAAAIGEADVIAVTDRDAALEVLTQRLRPGDVVLVKASRGVELDRLVDALVARLGGTDGDAR